MKIEKRGIRCVSNPVNLYTREMYVCDELNVP